MTADARELAPQSLSNEKHAVHGVRGGECDNRLGCSHLGEREPEHRWCYRRDRVVVDVGDELANPPAGGEAMVFGCGRQAVRDLGQLLAVLGNPRPPRVFRLDFVIAAAVEAEVRARIVMA
jgi:hypothetical protein